MESITKYITPEDVIFSLVNTPQITFEVTDACNLAYRYCGYRDLYSDYDKHKNIMLSEEKAFILLDYMNNL